MYKIFAIRKRKYQSIIDLKTKEVIDNGEPKQISLGGFDNENIAKNFAYNVRQSTKPHDWKIWVEEIRD